MADSYRILIAEDETELLRTICTVLRASGYTVEPAVNGVAALEILQDAKEKQESIDLLISDIQMPGISGEELIAEARKINTTIPILVITGYGDKDLVVRLLRQGCNEYLDKPFTSFQLEESVHGLLSRAADQNSTGERAFEIIGKNAACMLHDINNHLGAMNGYRDLLQEDLTNPDHLNYCKKMETAFFRAAGIVREAMAVTSKPTVSSSASSFLLMDVLAEMIEMGGLRAKIILGNCNGVNIRGNRQGIETLLWNLLKNADEALAGQCDGQIAVTVESNEKNTVVNISDNGPGIPEQIRKSLFTCGCTYGKLQGNGLGLYGAKRIMTAHGGEIHCTTETGTGTTFSLVFPKKESTTDIN